MCGIAGVAKAPNSTSGSLRDIAERMAMTLAHRGPDSQGVWGECKAGIGIAHTRLAVQDLSAAGHQPMESQSGRWVISFNGEIYNFVSLAKRLRHVGVRFKGHSDTEVLLALIEKEGLDNALEQIDGMFAFALWDTADRNLYLVRDRLGEKPLYFAEHRGTFLFASELKAIYSVVSPKALSLNYDAVSQVLKYGYVCSPKTIFREIESVSPGTYYKFELGGWTSGRTSFSDSLLRTNYWGIRELMECGHGDDARDGNTEPSEILENLLLDVVKDYSISDVPLGTFLSGGIDSTLVSSLLATVSSRPVKTFTVGFESEEFNEARFARAIAQHLGTDHHEITLSDGDLLATIPSLARIYDEPFANSAQIPALLVSRFARQSVTVCLSGDGGDELFGGYNRYAVGASLLRHRRRVPGWLLSPLCRSVGSVPNRAWDSAYHLRNRLLGVKGASNFGQKIRKALDVIPLPDAAAMYDTLLSYWATIPLAPAHADNLPAEISNGGFESDFVRASMLHDQGSYLPNDSLTKLDRASMACSLELRIPLLDRRIVEYSWSLSGKWLPPENRPKAILRTILENYVPSNLVERPKMGFTVPVDQWLRGPLREWASDLLSEQSISKFGVLDHRQLSPCFESHLSGTESNGNKLWCAAMIQAWLFEWLD